MRKAITLKDVIYAMQFGGETLCGSHADGLTSMPKWRLSKSGLPVPASVADQVRNSADCIALAPAGGDKEAYGWRVAA